MTIRLNSLGKAVCLSLLIVSLSACGGKKKAPSEAEVATATTNDITRPPEVAKDTRENQAESNPEETISFDEWRRLREAEKAADLKARPQ